MQPPLSIVRTPAESSCGAAGAPPTPSAETLTLADSAERQDSEGQTPKIAELLSQPNGILGDAAFMQGNLPTGHRSVTRTELPARPWIRDLEGCVEGCQFVPLIGVFHAAGCPNKPPKISSPATEAIGAEGRDERRPVYLKVRAHDCCAGVDLPGIGHTHAPDCAATAEADRLTSRLRALLATVGAELLPVVRSGEGAAPRPGHLPEPLQSMIAAEAESGMSPAIREYNSDRLRLLNLLACAVPDLVALNLRLRGTGFTDEGVRWCWECSVHANDGRIWHRITCVTGRVEGILGAIAALGKRPEERRASTDTEPCLDADDSRVAGLKCRRCLAVGGTGWTRNAACGDALMELNQVRVTRGIFGFDIYTHHCAANEAGRGAARGAVNGMLAAGTMADEMRSRGGAR